MSKKLKIGVIGCANIAERFVIPSIKELSNKFDLVGIASRTAFKADEFASKFKTTAFYDYDFLLDAKGLDAVYIPLPNSLHYEWIKKSLEKNLHILVEKSMACSYDEVLELNKIAKEKKLVLIENFQFRFHSQLQYMKNLVDSGKIGELRSVRSSFGFPPFSDSDNIRYKRELGGGALLDAGAYTIKVSQIFMGLDISVSSSSLFFDKEKSVDIWGNASLKQNKGALTAQVSFGFDNYYQCSIELWGSKGKIFTNRIFTSPPGYKPRVELETVNGQEIIELEEDHHFINMLSYFYTEVTKKKNLDQEYNQNLNQARLISEVLEKSKSLVMIIGGGLFQVPIVKKAKSMNLKVLNTNLYEDSPSFKYSDINYVSDILDIEKNLKIAQQYKPVAILSDQSDIAVKTVAYIAEKLALNGVGSDIADLFTNKFRMRSELNIKNLYHPEYVLCKSFSEVKIFLHKLGKPIIIKPLSSQSSRGVFKISNVEQLKHKFDLTMKFSNDNIILAEEYIGGIELTVEGFKTKDKHYSLAVSKKEHYKDLPSVAKSLIYLDEFDEFDINKIKAINNLLFKKLKFGITHVEYKYYNGKFYLIEAAIRGGGTKISSHIIPVVSGVDVNELLIQAALRDDDKNIIIPNSKHCAILKFFDFKDGKVNKINGLDYLNKNENIIDYIFEFNEGEIIKSPDDDRSRVGYYIAYAETKNKLFEIVEEINNEVYLEYV